MPNTILLSGSPQYPQERNAAEAITPGHLIEYVPSGVDAGKLRKHANAAKNAQPAFANVRLTPDRTVTTLPIDTPYAVGETVQWLIANAGDVVYGLVAAAAPAIALGDALESAGNGTVRKFTAVATPDTDSVVGYADEALDNSAGGAAARLRVRAR